MNPISIFPFWCPSFHPVYIVILPKFIELLLCARYCTRCWGILWQRTQTMPHHFWVLLSMMTVTSIRIHLFKVYSMPSTEWTSLHPLFFSNVTNEIISVSQNFFPLSMQVMSNKWNNRIILPQVEVSREWHTRHHYKRQVPSPRRDPPLLVPPPDLFPRGPWFSLHIKHLFPSTSQIYVVTILSL